ncbi:MAG TPA: DinB family protein [Pyrinomonadaceae bacterium]|nr:DinB family protein [Pyrinomonadaceae bacterium]
MSVEHLIKTWKETRGGLVEEATQVPPEEFTFRATKDTRSIAELLQHVVESQKMLVGEACRPDTNLMRQSFAEHIKEYAPEVRSIQDKNGLLELLRSSMELAEATIRSHAEGLDESMKRFDGATMSKLEFLSFAVSHEMYHRGQLTIYERLLNIEPALTTRFKRLFAQAAQ